MKLIDLRKNVEDALSPETYAAGFSKGVQCALQAGENSLVLAAKQNAALMATMKKALEGTPLAVFPGFEFATQSMEGYLAIQKNLIETARKQSGGVVEAMQSFAGQLSQVQADLGNMMQTFDASNAHQTVGDFSHRRIKALRDGMAVSTESVQAAEQTVRHAIESALATKSEMQNFAAQPVKTTIE